MLSNGAHGRVRGGEGGSEEAWEADPNPMIHVAVWNVSLHIAYYKVYKIQTPCCSATALRAIFAAYHQTLEISTEFGDIQSHVHHPVSCARASARMRLGMCTYEN